MVSPYAHDLRVTNVGDGTMPVESAAKVDIGKQTGLYDTASVRDLVYKWQASNAADTESSAPGRPRSEKGAGHLATPTSRKAKSAGIAPEASLSPKPSPAPPSSAHRAISTLPSRHKIDEEVHAASAPKKRVVSDEHWMKDRSDAKLEAKPSAKTTKIGTFQAVDWPAADKTPGPKRCDAWVRVREPAKEVKEKKVTPSPTKKRTPTKTQGITPRTPAKVRDDDSVAVNDEATSERKISVQSSPPLEVEKRTPVGRPLPKSPRTSGGAQQRPKSPSDLRARKRTPTKVDDAPKVPANPIDSWLGGTPDPFLEDPKRLAKNVKKPPSVFDIPSSLDDRSAEEQSIVAESEIERAERRRRRKTRQKSEEKRSPPSLSRHQPVAPESRVEPNNSKESPSPAPSTPTLKRRGAQHRHARGSSREATPESEQPQDVLLTRQSVQVLDMQPPQPAATTTHDDLMSVLSAPPRQGTRVRPSKSVLSKKTADPASTLEDLMQELKDDETKYLRELRTLVDGVIPVLLKTAVAQGHGALSSSVGSRNSYTTAAIVNMGVVLERLKGSHKRIPTSSHVALLIWAQNSLAIYADYLKVWRLGFEDLTVNLAPAEDHPSATRFQPSLPASKEQLDTPSTEKVDVAFLLKRPLVRVKHLAKLFKSIQNVRASEHAASLARSYQELVTEAKARQKDELARLEDEAASNVDPTRARDPRTLSPLVGARIDPARCVKARDDFDLKLQHTSGQRLDCRVELILREDSAEERNGGDLLVCEVNETSRWLLFPPLALNRLSAREEPGGLFVMMIRGQDVNLREWYELLSLRAEDEQAAHEWTQMMGTSPVPPQERQAIPAAPLESAAKPRATDKSSLLSSYLQENAGVPLGEPSLMSGALPSKPPSLSFTKSSASSLGSRYDQLESQQASDRGSLLKGREVCPEPVKAPPTTPLRYHRPPSERHAGHQVKDAAMSEPRRTKNISIADAPIVLPPPRSEGRKPKSFAASELSMGSTPNDYEAVRRLGKKRYEPESPSPSSSRDFAVWMPSSEVGYDDEEDEDYFGTPRKSRRRDPLPEPAPSSGLMSKIFRGRQRSQEREGQRFGSPERRKRHHHRTESAPVPRSETTVEQDPSRRLVSDLRPNLEPVQTPSNIKRRSSSPLKHEYTPSMASGHSEDRDVVPELYNDDDYKSINSDGSEEDAVPSLAPSFTYKAPKKLAPTTVYAPTKAETLGPSESASQAPYRSVPETESAPVRLIATIFCWSEKGVWESIHPDECAITVSAGCIEAYDLVALSSHQANGGKEEKKPKPLVAQELTPLVPLRRSTAIDISIRSPPTHISQLKYSANIMYRSRNNSECDTLYGLINQARINNPTYIALQNARGGFNEDQWGPDARGKRSWWKFGRRSSYRAGPGRPRHFADTESSVATMTTTASALRRFTGSKMFNVAKSTVSPRGGSRSSTEFSSSSGDASGAVTPAVPVGPDGEIPSIANMKIRLYVRENAQRWKDLGQGHMTIMQPPRPPGMPPPMSRDGTLIQQKRVVVLGKTAGETLLDVTLGDGSFERVARTGIAVSVWDELREKDGRITHIQTTGGVSAARVRVFMLQVSTPFQLRALLSVLPVPAA